MNIQLIPIEQVQPNPWQTRTGDDVAHVQALADDIAVRGLLQVPIGRWVTEKKNGAVESGNVQLAFGHSRLAAWQIAKPGELFPVDVRELSDKEMAEYAIIENAKRKDLSAIEKAQTLRRYIDEFNATQADAGKLFGLGQAAVSNLLRLLILPEPVQQLVKSGDLPERHARQLLSIAAFGGGSSALNVGRMIARAKEADRDETATGAIRTVLEHGGKDLAGAIWEPDWPGQTMSADISGQDHPAQIVACKRCQYFVQHDQGEYCTRPACYDKKRDLWVQHELERVAGLTGIAVRDQTGGKVKPVFTGSYAEGDLARKALGSSKAQPLLRLVPFLDETLKPWQQAEYARARLSILGSKYVALATTDLEALRKSLGVKDPADEKDREREREEKERARRKAEQEQRQRAEAENQRLIAVAAPLLCQWLPANLIVLHLVEQVLAFADMVDAKELAFKDLRATIMAALLLGQIEMGGEDDMHEFIPTLARALKVRLPKGWDKDPAAIPPAAKPARAPKGSRKGKR